VQIKLKGQKVDRGFLELQIDDPMVDCTIIEHDEYNVAGARGLFQDMCLRDLEYSFMRSFQETPWDPGGLQLQLEDKTLEMLSSPLEMLSRQNLGLLVVMVLNTLLSHKLSGRNSLLPEPLSHQVRFDVEDFQLPVTSYQANFCIILEWFSAMAITWNSLHDGMDASAKSWEQELYLTLVT
jgi:hypothetical protein